jgi:hypothetical protein
MKASLDAPCEKNNKCEQSIKIDRIPTMGKSCLISGDPHYKAFDTLQYDFQGRGSFYYVKSEYLTVQGYQFPCLGNGVTCIGAVAVK